MAHRTRVAFVDDSPEIRELAVQIFANNGIDIFTAERETVDLADIAAWKPDVIVIDPQGRQDAHRPPFEVARSVSSVAGLSDVPLVLLTSQWALWQHEMEVQALLPAAVLTKPFGVKEFLGAVRRAARRQAG